MKSKYLLKKGLSILLCASMLLCLFTGCGNENDQENISSSLTKLASDVNSFETTVSLHNMTFSSEIAAEQIKLGGAFANMKISSVKRTSNAEVKIAAEGDLVENEAVGDISFAKSAVNTKNKLEEVSSTDKEQTASEDQESNEYPYGVEIKIENPEAKITVENTKNEGAVVSVSLMDDSFKNELKPEYFTVSGDKTNLTVASVKRTSDTTCTVTFSENASDVFPTSDNVVLNIAADALNSSKSLSANFYAYDAVLSAVVDYVEKSNDEFLVTTILKLSNGTLADINQSSITLNGELGNIISLEKTDDNHLTLQYAVKKENATTETLSFDGTISVKGEYAQNLWGAKKSDTTLDIHYDATESNKELLAIETDLAFDLLKTGISTLAESIGSKSATRLLEVLDKENLGDKTAIQLSKLSSYLESMDTKWTASLNTINYNLSIMSEKIGKNECSRALDEFDTIADRLRSTLLHLEVKKNAVDSAKKGTAEYEKAKNAYIAAVEKENTKIYTEAHLLGKKIASGSSGLTPGIIGTYDDMLSYIYNFDVQTFDLKKDFRVFVLSLYMNAYDQTVLYYQLTDPTNHLYSDLKNQLVAINNLMGKMTVKTRAANDKNVYCYVAQRLVKRNLEYVYGNQGWKSSKNALDTEKATIMSKRAEYRGTTLKAEFDSCGFSVCTGNYNTSQLVTNISEIKNNSSRKREDTVNAETINMTSHQISPNHRTYYFRMERSWWDSLFDSPYTIKENKGGLDLVGVMMYKGC